MRNEWGGILAAVATAFVGLAASANSPLFAHLEGHPGIIGEVNFTPFEAAEVEPSLLGYVGSIFVPGPGGVTDPSRRTGVATLVRAEDGSVSLLTARHIVYDTNTGQRRNSNALFFHDKTNQIYEFDLGGFPAQERPAWRTEDIIKIPASHRTGDRLRAFAIAASRVGLDALGAAQNDFRLENLVTASALDIEGELVFFTQNDFWAEWNEILPWPLLVSTVDMRPGMSGSPVFATGLDGSISLVAIMIEMTEKSGCKEIDPSNACSNYLLAIEQEHPASDE